MYILLTTQQTRLMLTASGAIAIDTTFIQPVAMKVTIYVQILASQASGRTKGAASLFLASY